VLTSDVSFGERGFWYFGITDNVSLSVVTERSQLL